MSFRASVRPARAEDMDAVVALGRVTAGAPQWPEAAYREYLEEPAAGLQRKALWVAESSGSILGFAAANCVAEEAELETIAVAEAARRAGVGGRLLAAVEEWARGCRAHVLLLEVRAGNKGAQALYLSRRFYTGGLRARYYSHPVEDAVLMRLDLCGQGSARQLVEGVEL